MMCVRSCFFFLFSRGKKRDWLSLPAVRLQNGKRCTGAETLLVCPHLSYAYRDMLLVTFPLSGKNPAVRGNIKRDQPYHVRLQTKSNCIVTTIQAWGRPEVAAGAQTKQAPNPRLAPWSLWYLVPVDARTCTVLRVLASDQ